jgi:phosphoglycerol transferase MdoB-like AlkP superfamily enzyme
MLNIPRVSSVLATVTLESFFFGIYLIFTATALILLLKRRAESVSTRPGNRRLAVLLGISAPFLVVAGVHAPILQPLQY